VGALDEERATDHLQDGTIARHALELHNLRDAPAPRHRLRGQF
jgi:hypothetical protein